MRAPFGLAGHSTLADEHEDRQKYAFGRDDQGQALDDFYWGHLSTPLMGNGKLGVVYCSADPEGEGQLAVF